MSQVKPGFEQFLAVVTPQDQPFVQELHEYLLSNGCKATVEDKKSGMFASYKHTKSKKSAVNFFNREEGVFVRIYGENIAGYSGFLDTLPQEMVDSVSRAGVCKRMVYNTCSTKCAGYDFKIRGEHFQKCRYGGLQFLVTQTSAPFIKSLIENEIEQRQPPKTL